MADSPEDEVDPENTLEEVAPDVVSVPLALAEPSQASAPSPHEAGLVCFEFQGTQDGFAHVARQRSATVVPQSRLDIWADKKNTPKCVFVDSQVFQKSH